MRKSAWTILNGVSNKPYSELLHERIVYPAPYKEFVARSTGPVCIEPKWGYIFTEKGNLLEDFSRSLTSSPVKKAWHFAIPPASEYFKIRGLRNHSEVIYFPKIISLRFFWEWNYYHFYLEVLGNLALLDSLGFDPSIPIVLGPYANELPFVKQVINTGKFRNRNWIIQDDKTYVFAHEVITCYSNQTFEQRIDFLLDNLDIPKTAGQYYDRTFLTRNLATPRHLLNMGEIEKVLDEYGFNVVDTTNMPVSKQIEIFSKTGVLIGIHGAGLTNMIFRGSAPLRVLELCSTGLKPGDWTRSSDFKILCKELGHSWDELRGPPDDNIPIRANFTISPYELRQKIVKMLE